MGSTTRGFDLEAGARFLRKRDRALARWMNRIGPLAFPTWTQPFDTVDALARAILHQQLSGKAAATIIGRVEMALHSHMINADALLRIDEASLRACGVSGNKVLALHDLAGRAEAGTIPDAQTLQRLDDSAIIECLTAVRGIGRWTVEMLLMFRLGRSDVLPVGDLGVRKGAGILDGLASPPPPKALSVRGEVWAPYRSLAAFYLWRIADGEGGAMPAPGEVRGSSVD